MSLFEIISLVLALAAAFSYLNVLYLRWPSTIGLTFISLILSLTLVTIDQSSVPLDSHLRVLVGHIDFHETVMNGMLSFLLFGGALHVSLSDLRRQQLPVAALASLGVVISTAVTAVLLYTLLPFIGIDIPLSMCLVFGAMISPTDPVAVHDLMRGSATPPSLRSKIAGESLFNDGIAVVLFIAFVGIALGEDELSPGGIFRLTVLSIVGGIGLGLCLGFVAHGMLRRVDDAKTSVLISLALVTGGYSLARLIDASGPIAMVVAGLWVGNVARLRAMSPETRRRLDDFWELIDELLNSVLFVLIGLEVIQVSFGQNHWLAGLIAIPIVLFARAAAIMLPMKALARRVDFSQHAAILLIWGGLRGGISIALALSIPESATRDTIVAITYTVVVFSMLGQGMSFPWLLRRLLPDSPQAPT